MNKVCLYIGSYPPYTGGGFTYKTEVISAIIGLDKKNIEYFLAGENAEWEQLAKSLGCEFQQVPKNENKPNSFFLPRKKNQPNKRKAFLVKNQVSCVVHLSPLEWIDLDIPFVQVVWDLQHRRQPIFPEVSYDGEWLKRETLYKNTLSRAAAVIVGNESGKNDVTTFYGTCPENIFLIPLPTPGDAMEPGIGSRAKRNTLGEYIFYPAQLWPHKNHRLIIEAQKILKVDHQWELPLVLAGTDRGNLDALQIISRKYSVNHLFQYLGAVDRLEIINLYKNALALVFPSMFGPDNIPPLEAFALGCPVLAADVPGSREQLKNAAGWFDPLDAKSLVDQILKVKNDQEWVKDIVSRGKVLAKLYAPENYAQELLKVIEKVLFIKNRWTPSQ